MVKKPISQSVKLFIGLDPQFWLEQTSVITVHKLHRVQGNKCHIPPVVYGGAVTLAKCYWRFTTAITHLRYPNTGQPCPGASQDIMSAVQLRL